MVNRRCSTRDLWIAVTLILAPLLFLCERFLDLPVALYVKTHLYGNRTWSTLTANLPDLLAVLVVVVTCIAFTLYWSRIKRGIYDPLTSFARLVSWATPVSYLVKNMLKWSFGRVNTRLWVCKPDLYGFHWLHGSSGFEGFPSGHMLVASTILACFWRFFPGSRTFCLLLAFVLGVALLATNYHFLSDVIAGLYFGLLTEEIAFHLLVREPRRLGLPAF
ncbi:phosphatase PAP2 family protein [Geomonas sp.]|uniref:phosphatase PAP2 family protein n=1 Tax=Geomonas sp. TaxID=2651584 RepID=UPI002B46F6B9|nr:phosphatase PAP2 family protein [Geomonas sp.]HJV33854.1 phosphatase PAP2 family protein [Geomonas sp.]